MAGTSLLVLLDDIASVLDDVATLTKVATKKTAGVLGDDLALNAQQVTGVKADRELAVVWAVAKGSALNKVILVPAALAISALYPPAVTPLLMIGGAFLCFEGFEKIVHKFLHGDEDEKEHKAAVADPAVDVVAAEKEKIKGAIRTDFILSAEIVVISLGAVTEAAFGTRVAVLVAISAIMTVGVYGLVAGIVKLDDLGLHWAKRPSTAGLGRGLLVAAPLLMKFLSIAGTTAMFLVGGSIIAHGIPFVHHLVEGKPWIVATLADLVVGLLAGALIVAVVTGVKRLLPKKAAA